MRPEYDFPDECDVPVSICCGWPPIGETELCGCCQDHCGWFDEDEDDEL